MDPATGAGAASAPNLTAQRLREPSTFSISPPSIPKPGGGWLDVSGKITSGIVSALQSREVKASLERATTSPHPKLEAAVSSLTLLHENLIGHDLEGLKRSLQKAIDDLEAILLANEDHYNIFNCPNEAGEANFLEFDPMGQLLEKIQLFHQSLTEYLSHLNDSNYRGNYNEERQAIDTYLICEPEPANPSGLLSQLIVIKNYQQGALDAPLQKIIEVSARRFIGVLKEEFKRIIDDLHETNHLRPIYTDLTKPFAANSNQERGQRLHIIHRQPPITAPAHHQEHPPTIAPTIQQRNVDEAIPLSQPYEPTRCLNELNTSIDEWIAGLSDPTTVNLMKIVAFPFKMILAAINTLLVSPVEYLLNCIVRNAALPRT